jgi:SAM-dependent methyltransferase
MSQKATFLESEGDAWWARNEAATRSRTLPESDPLLTEICALPEGSKAGTRVLEVGCSDGWRLRWLKEQRGFECQGIEPSAKAVAAAQQRGLAVQRGTADALPFGAGAFDLVVFGFCLYLCDRDDLFRIASEADRVLANPGWLLILDFYSKSPTAREYHHRPGLSSYKMPYRTLFDWHPAYTVVTEKVRHHENGGYTDHEDEWVAVTVLRKRSPDG